jgi:archaellum component FlaC
MAKRKRNILLSNSVKKKLDDYRLRIEANWQKITTSIVAVAKACAEANDTLSASEKKMLLEQLPFGQAVFSKLAAIGNDKRLHKSQILKSLPPSYSIIYEVTHLGDKELNAAVAHKTITPSASRSEIVLLRKVGKGAQRKPRSANNTSDKFAFFADIRLPIGLKKERVREINRFLVQLEQNDGAKITRSIDLPKYAQLMDRYESGQSKYYDRVLLAMRSLLKNDISKLKTHIQHGKKTTGFISEEINLIVPQHELDERIHEVLKTLGRESDYDDLRKKAERITDTKALDKIENQVATTFPFADMSEEVVTAVAEFRSANEKKRRDFTGFKF